jgi:hypothetical protein
LFFTNFQANKNKEREKKTKKEGTSCDSIFSQVAKKEKVEKKITTKHIIKMLKKENITVRLHSNKNLIVIVYQRRNVDNFVKDISIWSLEARSSM